MHERIEMGDNVDDVLKQIKTLTIQQTTLANKVMALKRQLVGKSANNVDNRDTTTQIHNTHNTNEPKRTRGRPKKNTTVTSIISESPVEHTTSIAIANIYRYGNYGNNTRDAHDPPINPNLVYVIEDDDLFIRDNNGMLYNIDSREVIGWYNPYSEGCNVKWLYR